MGGMLRIGSPRMGPLIWYQMWSATRGCTSWDVWIFLANIGDPRLAKMFGADLHKGLWDHWSVCWILWEDGWRVPWQTLPPLGPHMESSMVFIHTLIRQGNNTDITSAWLVYSSSSFYLGYGRCGPLGSSTPG